MSETVPRRNVAAAWLFVGVVALTVFTAAVPHFPQWITGFIGWAACALLWARFSRRQSVVVVSLLIAGVAGIAWGMASGKAGLIEQALGQNIPLIGMLIAVSFLQLISVRRGAPEEALARGPLALLRTLVGVHLFGVVINFSAVAIFADRLSARSRLTIEQAMALSQAFIIGAVWSPFYGAMAVALTVVPGANMTRLMAVGIPVTVAAILITWWRLTSVRYERAQTFEGYPVRFDSLWVPALLTVSVLLVHELQPQWSVLAIIAALAPLVTIVTLVLRDGGYAWQAVGRLIHLRLPEMGGEISLFLAAGVLSAGMTGMIAALDIGVPFERFGGREASIVLVVSNVLAWIGFHPVIMLSVAGPWLAPLHADPNLLAMTFLMNWAVGLMACPMSNTLLAMYGRYRIPYRPLLAHNRNYALILTVLCIGVLNAYARWAM